jgi:hypothetical protein
LDVPVRSTYVVARMNLLLLLSALLSALSGAGVSVRPIEPAQAVAQGAAVRAAALPARDVTRRPQQSPAPPAGSAVAVALPTPALAPARLWMGRRRE